jgi:hypothetical protein
LRIYTQLLGIESLSGIEVAPAVCRLGLLNQRIHRYFLLKSADTYRSNARCMS